ncbi:uncharacterized protein V1513DRAFT_467521 [Lipomyces chichibuensis]|uniref:uncharacterized protein n=1 Tax=Lipomyces chichibuensis TaxID=1546026 RepID=UPI00334309F3
MTRAPANTSVEVTAKSAKKGYKGLTPSRAQTSMAPAPFAVPRSITSEMTTNDNEQVTYQRALNFLTANEPEKRLDIRLSYKFFQALEEQALALYGDEKHMSKGHAMPSLYPRVEYTATDSRVTIYTAPTPLHGSSAVSLERAISVAVRDVLVQHRKQELSQRIIPVGESTYSSVDEQGRRSTKTPDAGLKYYYDGHTVLTIIIEVGVSEGYTQLKADIMLWMNEFHCRTAILLYNKESPKFVFPSNADTYSISERPALVEAMTQTGRTNPFGPYCYREHAWFGMLDTAVLEVFKRDQNTGTVNNTGTYLVVQNGQMVVQGDRLDIGLTVGDVFPQNDEEIRDIQGERVQLEINFIRNMLASSSYDTAVSRFNHFIGED